MNTMYRWAFHIVLVCVLVFSLTLTTYAQTLSELGFDLQDALEVEVRPEIPEAGERVTIRVQNFSSDFTRATITWYVNGVERASGTGMTNFSFTAGDVGERTTVRMVAQKIGGGTVDQTFSFMPVEVSLLWEATSYVPPFYKGKTLHTRESPVRVVAFPEFRSNGTLLDPDRLVYTWTVDGKPRPDLSGFGKRTALLFANDTYRESIPVRVEVATIDNSIKGTEHITIPSIQPFLVFYKHEPLLGTRYETAIQNTYTLRTPEIRFIAEPYFFNTPDSKSSTLAYEWRLNNNVIDFTDIEPNRITLRHTEGTGNATLRLTATHNNSTLEYGQQSVTIRFGNN